jgi:hypothetical protein
MKLSSYPKDVSYLKKIGNSKQKINDDRNNIN